MPRKVQGAVRRGGDPTVGVPYAAAIVVAARTDLAGTVLQRRMCGDYRDLNRVTVPDRYTMPTAEEIFDRLANARLISTFDLRQGFNQIAIRNKTRRRPPSMELMGCTSGTPCRSVCGTPWRCSNGLWIRGCETCPTRPATSTTSSLSAAVKTSTHEISKKPWMGSRQLG
ncbi:hypothetical protein CLOM_g20970 [Closterium sp. NIES-68]|nr:hypothetical protein CLOM_g20970 [Closterium sp. NIES-68]